MYDPILKRSIQRWEYEGGRIIPGGDGFNTREGTEGHSPQWVKEDQVELRSLNQARKATERRN